jgi:hypothetical protein
LKNNSKLSKIYVTELGYVMAKIYYPKKRVWINYKIGSVDDLSENIDVSLTRFGKKLLSL